LLASSAIPKKERTRGTANGGILSTLRSAR